MSKTITIVYLTVFIAVSINFAQAQQAGKMPRVGILHPGSPPNPYVEGFKQGLRELRYVEGQNVVLEERWGGGKPDRLAGLAEELVRLKVDVIVASTTPGILAAKKATTTIPIVMGGSADPVGTGLVASLARPGGNITGLSMLAPDLDGKRVELLKEVVPKLSRVTMILDSANRGMLLRVKEAETAAEGWGVKLQRLEVKEPYDFEKALSEQTKERAGSMLVAGLFVTYRRQIVELATKNRIPAHYDTGEFVEAGGLLSYGPSIADLHRRAATYVDKILKGTNPADLPVEQPMKFDFTVNLKSASQIGLTIPPNVLARADRVIR